MRRNERAGKGEEIPINCRRQRVVGRRLRREERVSVVHHLRNPIADDIGRGCVGSMTVLRNPLEPPVERTHHAIVGRRCEPALPSVEEGLQRHFLYCGGAPPPPPATARSIRSRCWIPATICSVSLSYFASAHRRRLPPLAQSLAALTSGDAPVSQHHGILRVR